MVDGGTFTMKTLSDITHSTYLREISGRQALHKLIRLALNLIKMYSIPTKLIKLHYYKGFYEEKIS